MSRLIYIPNSASIHAARGFLTGTDWSLDPGSVVLRFHPRWCHMQPWVISAVAAWGLEARNRDIEITVENAERGKYAWRFGLADCLGIEVPVQVQAHEEAGRFVALRTIETPEEHGTLMSDVVPLLHLAGEPEQARAVQYVLSELIRNVREHSGSRHGAVVCAQYYRGDRSKESYVSVGVADTGIGLSESLVSNYGEASDPEVAVRLAVQPGVSGAARSIYGSSNNAGAGLFYTRRLAEASDQYFALASGGSMFRTSTAKRRPGDERLTFPISPYPGTVVCANFALHPEVRFDDFLAATGQAFTRLDAEMRERVASRVQFG